MDFRLQEDGSRVSLVSSGVFSVETCCKPATVCPADKYLPVDLQEKGAVTNCSVCLLVKCSASEK